MNVRRAAAAVPHWVRTVAAALVVGASFLYLGYSLLRGLKQLDLAQLQVRPLPLLLAFVLYGVASLLGAACWSLILDSLGQNLPVRTNVRIHFSAAIVKYLPGYVWQILGKAYLCNQQGLPAGPIGVGIALEFASVILTGLWVAVLTLPRQWLHVWGVGFLWPWRWPALAVLTSLCIALPWLLTRGLERLGQRRQRAQHIIIRPRSLWLMLVLMVAAWVVLGLTLHALAATLYPLPLTELPFATFCWAVSSLFSLAVVFVPMGIGVKEGLLAFLLGARVPMALAAVIAVLARLVSIASEALFFLIARRL